MKWLSVLLVACMMTTAHAAGGKGKDQKKREFFKKELNLTDEQLAKVKEIRKEHKDEVKALKKTSNAAKLSFREAMKNPNASKEDLLAKFDEFQKARDTFHRRRFAMMMEMRTVMTPEQIAKFSEWREKHKGQHRGKGKWRQE